VTSTTERPAPRSRGGGALRLLRDVLLIILAALLISFLIKTFLVRSFYIPSASMETTLMVNDRILVNELVPDLVSIQHGDVVVFADPGGWLTPRGVAEPSPLDAVLGFVGLAAPDSNEHLIKRVIGLPGDTVSCCNDFGQLLVNGVPLEEPYLNTSATKASAIDFSVTVPEGYLWVMGDNRDNSRDSRYNQDGPSKGFVPIENVVGRAFVVSWPVDRWAGLDNYPLVFEGVDEGRED